MRAGYAELAPLESSPLMNGRTRKAEDPSTSPLAFLRWTSTKQLAIGAAIVLAVVFGVLRLSNYPSSATSKTPTAPVVVVKPPPDNEPSSQILYRPLCIVYGSPSVKTRMIQTSMKEPSQQWSNVPCFQPEQRYGPILKRRPPTVQLNSYGAPDAILQVNFSQLAHPDRTGMPILGFGGAFTEAAALNFHRLSSVGQEVVLELLFGKTGLGYTIGRFPLNSCDFTVKSYSFDETVDDFELADFDTNVEHDVNSGMIDMALRAKRKVRESWGPLSMGPIDDGQVDTTSSTTNSTTSSGNEPLLQDGTLQLFASPWSPPAWMKKPTWEDPNDATHATKMTFSAQPNCLKEGVGPTSRYAKAWALYFSKFLTAYSNLGLPLKGVTVQNEPEFPAPWEACSYTPQTEHDFVAHHLGPQLAKDHPDVRIFIFDHNKDHVNNWTHTLLQNTSAAKPYISGTAYHWYAGGMDRLLDGALGIPNMHRLQGNLGRYGVKKDHIVLGSESCHCPTTGYAGGDINIYWDRAERYAHTILADLASGSNGWVEWNLILDGIGGPNHLGNLCESTLLTVPHRALNASHISPLPDFESDIPMGNKSVGDGRTREELNALGFPATYLDVGVAVQPIYYYMGHISRYVRPGSVAVMGLVQESPGDPKIFRPEGTVVAGGGQNDLARNGIEITLWPCEGSTRQQFKWNVGYNKHIQVYGHDWLGNPTTSCVGRSEDVDLLGLLLSPCTSSLAGSFDAVPIPGDGEGRFQLKLLNDLEKKNMCLVIRELANGGGAYGPRGGAQVTVGDCQQESAKWLLNEKFGEIFSIHFADNEGNRNTVCMTTGWPFLQMGAFLTPAAEAPKTVVILNEASEAANFALRDGHNILLTTSIPPRSIQTVLID